MNSVIRILFSLFALFFFVFLFRYYLTGVGGPTYLAVILVPVAFILFTLDGLRRKNNLYPRLSPAANHVDRRGLYRPVPRVHFVHRHRV